MGSSMATASVGPGVTSRIAALEKDITGSDGDVVAGGPAAMAQKHQGQDIDSKVLHDITEGEKKVTQQSRPVAGGPTAIVQSALAKYGDGHRKPDQQEHSGMIDGPLISKITEAEKRINQSKPDPTAGGPTSMAQKHTGEGIAAALHDITEGEKAVTHLPRPVAGGPTAVAMSELAKFRQEKAEKQTAV